MIWDAYRRTTYRVLTADVAIDLRIGRVSSALDTLLEQHQVTCWAFVTAWNPQSRPLPAGDNDRRQRQMLEDIERRGRKTLPGFGIGDDDSWPPEESVLVLGMTRDDAMALARRFDQRAIVCGDLHGPAELVRVPE